MHRPHHAPLAPGQIDSPHLCARLGNLQLESGEVILDCHQSYVTHGTLENSRGRVALLLTAIGAHHHRLDFLIGPGRAFDPAQWFVVVADAIGNGLSTSPSNSCSQPLDAFPRFTIRDMVAAQHRLLTQVLGVQHATVVVGASMGGMQALQWSLSHPDVFDAVVAMTPLARASAWTRAGNAAGRAALTADPAWDGARFRRVPERGLRAWSAIQHVLLNRTPRGLAADFPDPAHVQSWMDGLAQRAIHAGPDPLDWMYQSWAYDAHDLGTTPGFHGNTAAALAAVQARALLLTPPLDLYNPVEDAQLCARCIPRALHLTIPSEQGHQAANTASAADVAFVNRVVRRFLDEAT